MLNFLIFHTNELKCHEHEIFITSGPGGLNAIYTQQQKKTRKPGTFKLIENKIILNSRNECYM